MKTILLIVLGLINILEISNNDIATLNNSIHIFHIQNEDTIKKILHECFNRYDRNFEGVRFTDTAIIPALFINEDSFLNSSYTLKSLEFNKWNKLNGCVIVLSAIDSVKYIFVIDECKIHNSFQFNKLLLDSAYIMEATNYNVYLFIVNKSYYKCFKDYDFTIFNYDALWELYNGTELNFYTFKNDKIFFNSECEIKKLRNLEEILKIMQKGY